MLALVWPGTAEPHERGDAPSTKHHTRSSLLVLSNTQVSGTSFVYFASFESYCCFEIGIDRTAFLSSEAYYSFRTGLQRSVDIGRS